MADVSSAIKKPEELTPRQRWETEVKYAEKELQIFWDRATAANKRFIDERDVVDVEARKFNIFYANTNILESAVYSQVPKPDVSRRYRDYQDQVARVAALVLERCLTQDLQDPNDSFDSTMRGAVQDRLVAGLGTAWLRLETDTEDIPESEGGALTDSAQSTQPGPKDDGGLVDSPVMKKIKCQRVVTDFVYWKDFIFSPCRVWAERRWVGRRVYMTFNQLKKRFGEDKAKLTSLAYNASSPTLDRGQDGLVPKNEAIQMAVVYEIWDREARKVHWYCPTFPNELLDSRDDFLGLSSFEPCPEPMFANVTTSNCCPRPDYYMIQDQYIELDTVNARISLLVSACKVVGVYASNSTGLINLLKGAENTMVPVDNWAMFAEKGGVKGNIDWLPLDMVAACLDRLMQARESIKGQIYELTGIADIVRGESKASETLGAQQIKAKFAGIRISKLQDQVARFASNILRIKAEIMVKHFAVEQLIEKSAIAKTDNDEWVADALVLLKTEVGFNWRISIQSDSMAQADYESDKKDRIEFMSAVSGFLGNAMPMAEQIPETKPIILGLLKWGVAGFKKADDIEGQLDKQLSFLENKPPAPKPPDPKVQTEQMKQQTMMQKAKLDEQQGQQKMANESQRMQMEQQQKQQDMMFQQAMNKMEMQMKQFELMMKQVELKLGIQKDQADMEMDMKAHAMDLQAGQQEHQQNMEFSAAQNEQQLQASKQQSDLQLAQSKAAGQQKLSQGAAEGKQKLTLTKAAAAQKAKQPQGAK